MVCAVRTVESLPTIGIVKRSTFLSGLFKSNVTSRANIGDLHHYHIMDHLILDGGMHITFLRDSISLLLKFVLLFGLWTFYDRKLLFDEAKVAASIINPSFVKLPLSPEYTCTVTHTKIVKSTQV